jgi:hypothetical protein
MRRARTEPGGGTSVSAGRTISLGAVLLVAAATAVVVFLANREDATPQARAPAVVVAGNGPSTVANGTPASDGDAGTTASDDDIDISTIALDGLYEALGKADLHTWVDVEPGDRTTVVLRSWYCNNDDLKDAIANARTELRNNGFERVVCLERAGKQIFDLALR